MVRRLGTVASLDASEPQSRRSTCGASETAVLLSMLFLDEITNTSDSRVKAVGCIGRHWWVPTGVSWRPCCPTPGDVAFNRDAFVPSLPYPVEKTEVSRPEVAGYARDRKEFQDHARGFQPSEYGTSALATWRSVKPSAQPTLVRTQHPPPDFLIYICEFGVAGLPVPRQRQRSSEPSSFVRADE